MNEKIKPKPIYELVSEKWMRRFRQDRLVYSIETISPTVITYGGGGTEIKVVVENERKSDLYPNRDVE